MLKIWIVKRRDIQNPILEVPRLEFFETHAILKHLLQCLAHIELLRLLYQWQQLFCPFWYKIQFFIIICSLKVHIFWEGHKILRNLPLTFDYSKYICTVKSKAKISQNVLAFSKYMNFNGCKWLGFLFSVITVIIIFILYILNCKYHP